MPVFVAIDGEGLTRGIETCQCEGLQSEGTHTHAPRHDYVLLAASDGSFVESYADNGLGTEECLEYLLSLSERHKGAVLCGFYTSYDVNMIFRDFGRAILEGLWVGDLRSWRAKEGDYKQYRVEYIPNRVLKVQQGCWVLREGEEEAGPVWKTYRSFIWWDSFQFFQQSFVKALRDWKAAPPEVIDEILAMKDKRGGFQDSERQSIRDYCLKECELLVGMMSRLAETLDALDIRLSSWYGAGSIASAVFKREGVKKHIRREWDAPVQDAIMRSYFGGRVETFAVGIRESECYNWDVRSAYPSAMQSLPSLADCSVEHTRRYNPSEPYAIWRVRWEARSTPVRLTPFPFRHKKRIFWPYSGEGWYHAEEVRAASDVFGDGAILALTVDEGFIFHPANDELPFYWVPDMYGQRAALKRAGDAREKPLKLALNSGYGKCAQSIGGRDGNPPPYQCYLWAGMITAHCRASLLRAASRSKDVLAIATDGLFVGDKLDMHEGEGLGDWECATVEPGLMFIQPGVYASPSLGALCPTCRAALDGGKCPAKHADFIGFAKSRGFSARGIDYDKLLTEWTEKRMSGSISMRETRFIGFGYALAVNHLDTLWRRWITGGKTIHFSGTTSKSFDPTANHDAPLVRLVAPPAPAPGLSDAYVPRKRGVVDAKAAELQSELLACQPDLEDNLFVWRG